VSGLVEAASYNSRVEADLARLYLESEGVEAVLFDTEIGLFLPVRLMVPDEDVELAQRLLGDKR
jgi:hypothetical protein